MKARPTTTILLITNTITNLPTFISPFSINPQVTCKRSNSNGATKSSSGEFFEPNDYDLSVQITSYDSSSSGTRRANENDKNVGSRIHPNRQRRNRVIWVVDDEEAIVDAVGSYLHSSGYEVQTFTNATMPLSLLGAAQQFHDSKQHQRGQSFSDTQQGEQEYQHQHQHQHQHEVPDAIISDIMMPNISGLQFLSIIRSSPTTNKIPFIFLTAKGTTNDRIRGYDSGADGYLMKPFDPEELVAMLDCMVDRREFLDSSRNSNDPIGTIQNNNGNGDNYNDGISMEELKRDLKEIKTLLLREENNIALTNKQKKALLPPSPNRNNDDLISKFDDTKFVRGINDDEELTMTDDEMEVLRLLCDGYMNKEIAEELRYSRRWVEGRLSKLFRKTGCANRTELVKWAVSFGYDEI